MIAFWIRQPATLFLACLTIALCLEPCSSPAAKLETRSSDPYLGAIVIDADSGQILFADNPDAKGYPASVLKLMDLLIILEKVQEGKMTLQDKITVTAEAAKMGGSQVYLKENEVFTVDELLYALIVQSANDAATALAIHVAGSKQGFVALMNNRAKMLGMKSTQFHSIHGLPPGKDQLPDVTTARDLTRLCREVLKHPDTLRYTSTRERGFRDNKFIMRTHNRLMANFDGCDGLKTGFFDEAGFSIVATARRDDTRIMAIVLGSVDKKTRDRKARELLATGFMSAPKKEALPPTPVTNAAPVPSKKRTWWPWFSEK